MKNFVLGGLSVLLLSTIAAPAVQAQVAPAAPPANAETMGMAITPDRLVFLAYQGFFESEGIPKFIAFVNAVQSRQVTAQDLVQVAVDMQRLPADTLNDSNYLAAVEHQISNLYGGRNR